MSDSKIDAWADKLLDMGKTNNLMRFRDTKSSSAFVIYPDANTLFRKADGAAVFEVYDPFAEAELALSDEENAAGQQSIPDKESFLQKYAGKLKRANQVLLYNPHQSASHVLKNIAKRAKSAMEETGVNVAWFAVGFVLWHDGQSDETFHAPLLLIPVQIERANPVAPWTIKTLGDEAAVNSTFDYSLQQQYGFGLPPYEDEDLSAYLAKAAEAVKPLGWSVSDECRLGIFSFLKINMYRDLKDNKSLIANNPNVRLLLGDDIPPDANAETQTEDKTSNPLIELHNVVDADSSQIDAVRMVKSGKSFVLQGPPGTGKSQTITNMIAECLYDGKKVLFVAEKQAALNVVFDKLRNAGLDEFCLALHSHKANKKEVIAQLCRTLRLGKTKVSKLAEDRIAQKQAKQAQLDGYDHKLHEPRKPLQLSLYQMMQAFFTCSDAPDIHAPINNLPYAGLETLRHAEDILEQYAAFTDSVGCDYRQNVWFGYADTNSSFENISAVGSYIETLLECLPPLLNDAAALSDKYHIVTGCFSRAEDVSRLCKILADGTIVTREAFSRNAFAKVKEAFARLRQLAAEIAEKQTALNGFFDAAVYEINGAEFVKRLTGQYASFWARAFGRGYRQIAAEIRGCTKSGQKVPYEKAVVLMKTLRAYQSLCGEFDKLADAHQAYLGSDFRRHDTDWQQFASSLDLLDRMSQQIFDLDYLGRVCDESNAAFRSFLRETSGRYDSFVSKCKPAAEALFQKFDNQIFDAAAAELSDLYEKLLGCHDNIDKLPNWISFCGLLTQINNDGLKTYLDAFISGGSSPALAAKAYRKLFFRTHAEAVVSGEPELDRFTRAAFDGYVKTFCEADNEHFRINKALIREKVSAARPDTQIVAPGSPVQFLFAEERKKRRQKPIRELLAKTAELVQQIKPCFMMSPLSVSTYLADNKLTFDTVIFDEASQIFPQDAIGAIYRGAQVVIVGDCKQMPPTDFFHTALDADNEDDEDADFESILDLCLVRMSQQRLRWHYRSRSEALITFSNVHFYDNDLVTFPAAKADREQDGTGVDFYHVDGVYDRRTRTNRIEAQHVVDRIYRHIAMFPNRSLGVVAFSMSQADLIDRILTARRRDNPAFEHFFDAQKAEPFFIKNLETVQGDERDTIIFSTAYGRDKEDKLLLNFGPINRLGGERRLNVAVTRAKDNIQVVTSLYGSDIDLRRTSSKGAALFKSYLDYAEAGGSTLAQANDRLSEHTDDGVVSDIYDFLLAQGFAADRNVGLSDYRVDIGVRDPDTGDYVLAVECDGDCYHNCANTRDRERLRRQILHGMGWDYYRIWSLSWFRSSAVEKQQLIEAVKASLASYKNKINDGMAKTAAVSYSEEDADAAETDAYYDGVDEESDDNPTPLILPASQDDDYLKPKNDDSQSDFAGYETAFKSEAAVIAPYESVDLSGHNRREFTDRRSFLKFLKQVLAVESPLSYRWLLKRLDYLFAAPGSSGSADSFVKLRLSGCENFGIIYKNGFLFLAGAPVKARGILPDGKPRDVKYVCTEEFAAALQVMAQRGIYADKTGLYKLIAAEMGYSRLTPTITARLDEAMALVSDKIEFDGTKIRLREG